MFLRMILRAEQGPLTSPSPCLLPGGPAGWIQPLMPVPAERLCGWSWVWASALGERDREGRLARYLLLAFSLMKWGSGRWGRVHLHHNGLRQRLLGHFSMGLCWLGPRRARPGLEQWGNRSSVPKGRVSEPEGSGGVFLCSDGTSERAGGMTSACLT